MTICEFCTLPCVPTQHTPGYGVQADGKKACFACCAWLDVFAMASTPEGAKLATVALYVSPQSDVTNWPGTLRTSRTGLTKRSRPGWGGVTRWQVCFNGPGNSRWSGTAYSSDDVLRNVRRLTIT